MIPREGDFDEWSVARVKYARGDRPFVSIIMPVYNEARYISRSIRAVLAQDYPLHLLEVIVADGMSTDGTRDIVGDYQSRDSRLRLVDNPERIVPRALNIALTSARGDVVTRVDGHCVIAPDYVSKCVDHLSSEDVEGVGGVIRAVGESRWARVIASAISSRFGVGGSAFRTGNKRQFGVDTVPFPAYKRSALEAAGSFDEELVRNQDDEYNYRLRKMGARLLLAPDLQSIYFSRSSLVGLWKQYSGYGYWKVRVLQKHPRQMRLRQFVPPLFAGALLLSSAMSLFAPVGRWPLVVLAGCYLCSSFVASVVRGSSNFERAVLPLAFAAIHFGYGLGFLWGLLRFSGRWLEPAGVRNSIVSMR